MRYISLFILITVLFTNCSNENAPQALIQPNIVWIVAEDLSPVIPSFGDSTIITPTLSRLAAEGVCYDKVFSPSGVCAPSRAAIATGMYPTHIGANHMRTGPWFPGVTQSFVNNYAKNAMPPDISPYEAIPSSEVKMMSEYLRGAGYYCTNNAKEDYQFKKSLFAWDESSRKAHWRNRGESQPFFSVFNIEVTHESRIWAKAHDSLWVSPSLEVPVPPYLPTTDSALIDIRRMYSNIKEMDQRVGEIIDELEDEGLLDNTIIFWYTDHGGPLPRQKRLTYDSGLRVPMIIRFPDGRHAGTRDGQLISFIDFAPSVLSLANIEPPDYLDGRAFLGRFKAQEERAFIHAASDRFDETAPDPIRAVRNKRYKYIKYLDVEKPMFYHVNYRNQMPIMRELYKLREKGKLNETQQLWFRPTKPSEELFDTEKDIHEVNNLAENLEYAEIKSELSGELDRWMSSFDDVNILPEEELLMRLWPGGSQPKTSTPVANKKDGLVSISSETDGASIGYKVIEKGDTSKVWQIYQRPVLLKADQEILYVADRLGYVPSDVQHE